MSEPQRRESTEPDAITARMASIRGELRSDAGKLAQSTRRFLDWTAHVREHPWTSLGVVAALAYYLVPKRVEITRPDARELEKLAEDNKVVIESNPTPRAKSTVFSGLTSLITHTVLRGALGMLTYKIGEMLQPPEPDRRGEGSSSDAHSRSSGGSAGSSSAGRTEVESQRHRDTAATSNW